ncbi:MAG: translation initiation factor IF-3 [Nitrospirae bacterium]|nr:translation initiation factor IF-3 [Nitrospirota bacterium]
MSKDLRVNTGIRAKEVRLIGHDSRQVGIIPIREALKMAEEAGLDLVEVSPGAAPPVCRIMNFGKYRYELSKKHTSKHKTIDVKEVKIRPQITEHDLELKIKNIKRFLEEGDKAKVTMIFRGREIIYSSLAKRIFDRIRQEFADKANIEQEARLEGKHMIMVFSPK